MKDWIKMKKIIYLTLILLLISSTAAIPFAYPQDEVTLIVGWLAEWDPSPNTCQCTYSLYRAIEYTTLMRFKEGRALVPHLAKSAEQTSPTTWEVKLNEGVTWHDGKPLTAEDVKWTMDHILADTGAQHRFVKGVKSVEVVDDYTFIVTSEAASPVASWLHSMYPLPRHFWEENDAVGAGFLTFDNDPFIGNGPFKYVQWRPGEFVELEAFDDFFLGKPKVDRLIIRHFDNVESMISAFKAKEVDLISGVPIAFAGDLDAIENVEVVISGASSLQDIYINMNEDGMGHPALLDRELRWALLHAVDRAYINEQVFFGAKEEALSIIPTLLGRFYADELEDLAPKFDLDKANEILDDAGYERGSTRQI
jgi:peptide/nickel transport system substrate-binding protein